MFILPVHVKYSPFQVKVFAQVIEDESLLEIILTYYNIVHVYCYKILKS